MVDKICTKCKQSKSISGFNSDKSRVDGKFPWCRQCARTNDKARSQNIRYKLLHNLRSRKYIRKYPDRQKARTLINNHRYKYTQKYCENCGNQDRLQMHHYNYSKPTEVVALCIDCHESLHHRELKVQEFKS